MCPTVTKHAEETRRHDRQNCIGYSIGKDEIGKANRGDFIFKNEMTSKKVFFFSELSCDRYEAA